MNTSTCGSLSYEKIFRKVTTIKLKITIQKQLLFKIQLSHVSKRNNFICSFIISFFFPFVYLVSISFTILLLLFELIHSVEHIDFIVSNILFFLFFCLWFCCSFWMCFNSLFFFFSFQLKLMPHDLTSVSWFIEIN